MKKIFLLLSGILLLTTTNLIAQESQTNKPQLSLDAELGFLSVLSHRVQFGQDGTYFNYVENGGQDVLFPFTRFSITFKPSPKNHWVFLYQPLRLESSEVLNDAIRVDGQTFPAGTPMNFLYNFPFFRLSYLRILSDPDNDLRFGIGASLQIRNATINFASADGTLFRSNRNIGPVPALKFKLEKDWAEYYFLELEADGMYAPISYLNGSDNKTIGSILDANARMGYQVNKQMATYLNVRYLGGGALNEDENDYTKNWLNFLTVSVGFRLTL
ncbi:hypothetical protein [Persicobacter psychrovividus]|uniref:Outer membrane protein beta-barrel domain-containing protein n=1 Tax=Persicobacter psychrovividus TaxID=387638 RepID=A0ABN6LGA7_9BACT|nr:hypothetical protein PEPS_44000 [Persicobacter psychrovividus]